jgi:branched-chain amino acid transport system permease protein
MSAQVIIFVLIGGVGTLVGPMIGAIIVQSLLIVGGTQQTVDPNLGLGVVLIGFVLLVPQGLLPTSRRIVDQLLERSRSNSKMQNSPSGNALDKVAGEIKL